MTLKKCILTENDCFKKGTKIAGGKPTGIVVHSTGANNKAVKRYVQPLPSYPDYEEILEDLGKNAYGNHWNRNKEAMQRSSCVHAFIGTNAKNQIVTYQTLPFDICCWGVGSGAKGSYNYNPQARIQFEICEDNLSDEKYFTEVFAESFEFCAYLCKLYGFGVDKICSHAEAHKQGYGSNHGDCDHWLKKFGKDMNWYRAQVAALLKAPEPKPEPTPQPVTPPVNPPTGVKEGDLVKLVAGATYYSGKSIPAWVSGQNWYVKKITGDRAVIDKNEKGTNAINSPVNVKNLILIKNITVTPEPKPAPAVIVVGSRVKVKAGAKTYTGGNLAKFVYEKVYDVQRINADRVVIGFDGQVTAAIKIADLILQ